MEQVEVKLENEKPVIQVDRIALGKDESQKLENWLLQVESVFNGLVKVSKSDLVNFFIQNHSLELSKKELKQIKAMYHSEVKFAKWALNKLMEAEKTGEELSLSDLIKLQNAKLKLSDKITPLIADVPAKSKRGRKRKVVTEDSSLEPEV
ncbi:MAG: hypothetical protein IPM57_02565 [Oligoflexia bacterium]|nr:hypothetical protein [Oligoflexia bacterium]